MKYLTILSLFVLSFAVSAAGFSPGTVQSQGFCQNFSGNMGMGANVSPGPISDVCLNPSVYRTMSVPRHIEGGSPTARTPRPSVVPYQPVQGARGGQPSRAPALAPTGQSGQNGALEAYYGNGQRVNPGIVNRPRSYAPGSGRPFSNQYTTGTEYNYGQAAGSNAMNR